MDLCCWFSCHGDLLACVMVCCCSRDESRCACCGRLFCCEGFLSRLLEGCSPRIGSRWSGCGRFPWHKNLLVCQAGCCLRAGSRYSCCGQFSCRGGLLACVMVVNRGLLIEGWKLLLVLRSILLPRGLVVLCDGGCCSRARGRCLGCGRFSRSGDMLFCLIVLFEDWKPLLRLRSIFLSRGLAGLS